MTLTPEEVKVKKYNSREITVECPLCGERIPRTRSSWVTHMNTDHSAADGSWGTRHERGGGQQGFLDPKIGKSNIQYPYMCYGCTSTFATESELVSHLSSIHSAS
jgi:uncharacterized Zn-finger protein